MTDFLPVPADLPEPVLTRPMHSGVQALWRFPNGRGASVVNHSGSYGTELAVLRYHGGGVDDWELDYSTPVTDDVVGHIDGPEELVGLLRQVRDLPPVNDEGLGSPNGDPYAAIESLGRMLP